MTPRASKKIMTKKGSKKGQKQVKLDRDTVDHDIKKHIPILLFNLLFLAGVVGTLLEPVPVPFHVGLVVLYALLVSMPHYASIYMAFVLGFMADIFLGPAMGVYTVMYTGLYVLIQSQQRRILGQPYWVKWAGMAVLALIFYGIEYIVAGLAVGALYSPLLWLRNIAEMIFLFPFVSLLSFYLAKVAETLK